MKELDYGTEYKYSHAYTGNFVDQEFMPEGIQGTTLYSPGKNSSEDKLRSSLKEKWKNKYGY